MAKNIPFRLCYENTEQFPYYLGDTSEILEKKPGVSIDLIRLATKDLGLSLEWQRAPWKRCLSFAKKGSVDAIFNASYKKDRLKIGRYPSKEGTVDKARRLTTLTYALYVSKHSNTHWNGHSFVNLHGPVGLPVGYSIITMLRSNGVEVIESVNTTEGFKMLANQQVAAFAAQTATGDSLLKNILHLKILSKHHPI